MSDEARKLDEVLRRVPEKPGGISTEALIPHIVGEILRKSRTPFPPMTSKDRKSWKGVIGELREMAASRPPDEPLLLPSAARDLRCSPRVVKAANRLVNELEFDAETTRHAKKNPKLGAPKKVQAPEIADLLHAFYRVRTGEEPTASQDSITERCRSPFVTLLEKVYTVLAIDASASSQATQIIKKNRKALARESAPKEIE